MAGRWVYILTRLISAGLGVARSPDKPPYRETPMLPAYAGEHVPGNMIWDGSAVEYLTDAERAPYALTFRDGLIFDANGSLFDTTGAETLHSGPGRAIFVMDASGNFYASMDQKPGEFHHSSLVAGGPVAAAGELEVGRGGLKTISDKSGHYRPRLRYTEQAIAQLKRTNISLREVEFDFVGRI